LPHYEKNHSTSRSRTQNGGVAGGEGRHESKLPISQVTIRSTAPFAFAALGLTTNCFKPKKGTEKLVISSIRGFLNNLQFANKGCA
jgi:hypothetical protein